MTALQHMRFPVNIAKFIRIVFYIEFLWWLFLDSNLILAMQILTKMKSSYFYILIIATQTKQILPKSFFFFFINSGFYLTLLSKATFSQRLSFFTVCWVSRTLKETFLKFGSPDRWKRHFQYTFLTSNYTLFITDKHNFSLWILWFRDKVHEILSPKLNRIKFKN